ncbi:MAG: type II toxin-antitoxin system VapC family toxin [Gaiellaceae bacterium]
MVVVDTSALVDYLLGDDWATTCLGAEERFHAPYVLDVEVFGVCQSLARRGLLSRRRALSTLEDYVALRIDRYPHVPLLTGMWRLRENVAARDAAFVALADVLDAELVTTDRRLARAVAGRVRVIAP